MPSAIPREKMRRATYRTPCPICDHRRWCGISQDGAIVICMRRSDGAVSEAKNGGWVHRLKDTQPAFAPIRTPVPQPSIASIERRDIAYSALLDRLPLSLRHSDDLSERGLADTEVARHRYATAPNARTARIVSAELAERFDLSNVPGFFCSGDEWRLNLSDWHAGILIPVRDVEQRIQALQIRRDNGDPRYVWFSSANKLGGASSGSPIHFARPWRVRSQCECVVTEGPLKADIVAQQLDVCVAAVAGVGSFGENFGHWLRQQLPDLNAALIAFDSDWKTKPEVERAMVRLARSLQAAGLGWDAATWDARFKGLDDYLTEVARCKA